MKFSFIIPVYNTSAFLERCVQSILNQTYTNFEIILVNDGSTDQSPELCDQLAAQDSRITVLHQTNQGLPIARNKGLEQAAADYILFTDSDDYYEGKTRLEEIAAQLSKNPVDLLFFDFYIEKQDAKRKLSCQLEADFFKTNSTTAIIKRLIEKDYLMRSAWSKVIKHSLLLEQQIKFMAVQPAEDTIFTADLLRSAKSIDWFKTPFYVYVKHDSSLSSKRLNLKQIEDSGKMLQKAMENAEKISDNELKSAYLAFLTYPYAVLLGQAKELASRDKDNRKALKNQLKNLQAYQDLLKFNLNPRIKKVVLAYRYLGYKPTVFLLGLQMTRTYQQRGIRK